MLALLLKILSIIGIILLILLALLLLFLLLVLFFPISYSFFGKKNAEELAAGIRAKWLFGFLRMQYVYPEPAQFKIKLLWLTLFDSGKPRQESSAGGGDKERESGSHDKSFGESISPEKTSEENTSEENAARENASAENVSQESASLEDDGDNSGNADSAGDGQAPSGLIERIKRFLLEKYEKIVYTFRSMYDKIKHIWENISCYTALLKEEETALLFQHVKKRGGKIWKSIRPRKLRAKVVFGTGSPDTTGYAYGIYGMLSPQLGPSVAVTPDFTQAIFEGEATASGRITAFKLLWHGGHLALDKRLHLFISRLKSLQTLKNGGNNGR